jgi:hypothetical protein
MEADMALPLDAIADAPFAGAVRLGTDAVLARTAMSGLDAARAKASGELSVDGPEGGRVLLEVGGTAVAEGRVVRRRGASCFRVERMLGQEGKEAAK